MSPHVYRCPTCRIESPQVPTREDAERLQALHRAAFHGGDHIEETPGPPPASGWRTAALLLGVMAIGAVSLAIGWLRRHL